jgi:protein SCO1/2
MKNAIKLGLVFGMSAFLFTSCGGETKSSDSVETSTAYQCPMKCEAEKTYDKEGKCPVCKMDLKEVK